MAKVLDQLDQLPREELFEEEVPVFTLDQSADFFEVKQAPEGWRVSGPRIKQLAAQTYWDNDEAVMRAYRILEKIGVHDALREAGVEPGDTVFLEEVELEWVW
jgi:GTP-binding protein